MSAKRFVPALQGGSAILSAGTVTVDDTRVTDAVGIVCYQIDPGGTVGALFVSARTAGTSFTIKSTSSTDTSKVGYFFVNVTS